MSIDRYPVQPSIIPLPFPRIRLMEPPQINVWIDFDKDWKWNFKYKNISVVSIFISIGIRIGIMIRMSINIHRTTIPPVYDRFTHRQFTFESNKVRDMRYYFPPLNYKLKHTPLLWLCLWLKLPLWHDRLVPIFLTSPPLFPLPFHHLVNTLPYRGSRIPPSVTHSRGGDC